MTMIFVSLDIGCSKIHDTYPGMFLAAVGFVMACLGLLWTVCQLPMLDLNHLPESSIKSSTLSLTNSLDRFQPLFI